MKEVNNKHINFILRNPAVKLDPTLKKTFKLYINLYMAGGLGGASLNYLRKK